MKTLILSILFILSWLVLYSQKSDTLGDLVKMHDSISKQRNQYKKSLVDLRMPNESSGTVDQYEIFYQQTDTCLIRRTKFNDEGGAFSKSTSELYFWDNVPFLYIERAYASWTSELTEQVVYFLDNEIILQQKSFVKKEYMDVFNSRLEDISIDVTPSVTETNVMGNVQSIDSFLKTFKLNTSRSR